ncbi:MAG: Peptidyl-tRNA hydrolase [Firmicutes bacterium]|nr:Peptidyl-tRNA hydrolase [Bacillota bacterium]
MKLIVGLGNPGAEYAGTRHNAGFAVVGELAAKHGVRVSGRSYQSLIGRGKIGGASVYLQQPLTYMNRCGQAVKSAVVALGIDLSDLLVISDDLDLPLGSLRIRAQGGAGGQKGLQSISDCLGTTKFARLRLGIGRPSLGVSTEDYVLGRFGGDEKTVFASTVERALEVVETFVLLGVETAANRHNNRAE